MRKKRLRGGVDQTVVATREEKAEPASVRLRTALHGERLRQWFRVVARLADGGVALVAVGDTREEALATARANAADLPEETVGLALEEWKGGLLRGGWVRRSHERNELPPVAKRRKKGRRAALADR